MSDLMSREEAIFILQKERDEDIFVLTNYRRRIHKALDMAIEALDRETRKYDAIYDELVELKNDLTLPLEVAMAYEKSIAVVKKYARIGESDG